MIECRKKDCHKEDNLHEHHLIPKFMGGVDFDGRKRLCEKHHNILQLIIPTILWKYIPYPIKEKVKQEVKEFSLRWLER